MICIRTDADIAEARKLTTSGTDCVYECFSFNHQLLKNIGCRHVSQLEDLFGKNLADIRKKEKINKLRSEAHWGLLK